MHPAFNKPFKLIIPPRLSFEKRLELGNYDMVGSEWKGEKIGNGVSSEHFPINWPYDRGCRVIVRVVPHGPKPDPLEQMRAKFVRENVTLSGSCELLSFGQEFPDIQREVCVESLHFATFAGKHVLALDGNSNLRRIFAPWIGGRRDPELDGILITESITPL